MKKSKKLLLLGGLVLVLVALWAAWRAGWFAFFLDQDKMRQTMEKAGFWGPLLFFVLQLASVILAPIPGNVTTLVGGALFGFWTSFFISVLATVVGSAIAFALARRWGMPLVTKLAGKMNYDKYMDLIKGRCFVILAMAFVLPFFPDDVLCFLAGLTKIKFWPFMLLVMVTRPWGLAVSSLLGSGAYHVPWWGWGLVLGACAALMVLTARYGDRIENRLTAWMKRIKEGR